MNTRSCALVLLLLSPSLHGQNRLFLSAAPGISLYNSENAMLTIGDKSVSWFPGLSVAYERENMSGVNWHVEYNFSRAKVEDVLDFIVTGPGGPTQIGVFNADLILSVHSVDLALFYRECEWLSFAIGPTVSLIHRTIETNGIPTPDPFGQARDFEDRLTSLGVGLNGSVNVEVPFDDVPPFFFFYSILKARYVHSVWFDKRGRNLGNYQQSFLVGQWYMGLGYNF